MTGEYLIKNPLVLDVEAGRTYRADVLIRGGRIASVGPDGPRPGPGAETIEAGDYYLFPGFLDAHSHTDLFFNPAACSDAFVTRGVTSIFSDNHDCAAALGPGGYEKLLDASKGFNIRYFVGLPAASPPYLDLEGPEIFPFDDFARILAREEVLSLSEVIAWPSVIRGDRRVLDRLELARRLGKRVEGHTVGASPEKLKALAEAGVTSCHESLSARDVEARLEAGLWVMVRDGSIRSDLEKIVPWLKGLERELLDRVCLVTDGIFAEDYVTRGGLDDVLARAIGFGLDYATAVRMVTLNPARYFGLDDRIGRIEPGYWADLVLVEDPARPTPHLVMLDGRPVARDGALLVSPSPLPEIGLGDRPFTLGRAEAEDFELYSDRDGKRTVPVIRIVDQTVTAADEIELEFRNHRAVIPDQPGLLRAGLAARDGKLWGLGLVRGLTGENFGALASSTAHDCHGLLTLGADPADMAEAMNRVVDMKGGVVIMDKGREVLRIPLPLGGIMADLDFQAVADLMGRAAGFLRARGAPWPVPLLPAIFLSFTSILQYRLTHSGVYDVRRGEIIFNGARPRS